MTKNNTQNPEASKIGRPVVEPDFYSVAQVVIKTGLSRSQIYNYMTAGLLKFIKAGSRRLIEVAEYAAFKTLLRNGQLAS